MPLEITPYTALADRTQDILASAVQLQKLPNMTSQDAAVAATVTLWRQLLKREIEAALDAVLMVHELIEGELGESTDASTWQTLLDTAILAEISMIAEPISSDLYDTLFNAHEGDHGQIAFELAKAYTDTQITGIKPGKWLAAVGIAKTQLDWLKNQANNTADIQVNSPEYGENANLPTAVAPAPPVSIVVIEEDFIDGLPQAAAPLAPAVPPPPAAAPDKAAIAKAFKLYYDNAGPGVDDMAAKLAVSRGTMMNYFTGRTQPKCTLKQALIIIADIDRRQAGLIEAAAIFSAIRD